MPIKRIVFFLFLWLGCWVAFPSAWAQELRIQLQSSEGREIHLRGTRDEIFTAAENFTNNGEFEFARICYLRLIENDPQDVRAYVFLGQLYQFQIGRLADALTLYKQAERLVSPTNPGGRAFIQRLSADGYRELAEKTNSLIYFVQAIGEYEKVLEHDPNNLEVLYYLASCRLNSKDYQRAIELFETLMAKDSKGEWKAVAQKAIAVARREIQQR